MNALHSESTQDLFDMLSDEDCSQSVTQKQSAVENIDSVKSNVIDLSAAIDPLVEGNDDAAIKRLAALSPLDYDRVRKTEAEALAHI
jgi:hypothetical protein